MSYVDNHLLKDEMVIYRTQLHWKIFIAPIIFMAITIGIFALVKTKFGYHPPECNELSLVAFGAFSGSRIPIPLPLPS